MALARLRLPRWCWQVAAAVAAVATAAAGGARAYQFQQRTVLNATDGAPFDSFALRLDMAWPIVAVGAPDTAVGANEKQGAVYLFDCTVPTACAQTSRVVAEDGAYYDLFGASVDVSAWPVLVAGKYAPLGGGNLGAAYVFSCTSSASACEQTAKLTPEDPQEYDAFGWTVAVAWPIVVVGADGKAIDGGDAYRGAAYVFECASVAACRQTARLQASDGAANDYFAYSLAVAWPLIAVGALFHQVGDQVGQGAVYLYNCTSPSDCPETAQLTSSDGRASDYFGTSVAVAGPTVLVGAPGTQVNVGSAYLFDCEATASPACTESARLNTSALVRGNAFGASVALAWPAVLVSAPSTDRGDGVVYVYDCTDAAGACVLAATLDGGDEPSYFGIMSIAVQWPFVCVGVPYANSYQGNAVLFEETTASGLGRHWRPSL